MTLTATYNDDIARTRLAVSGAPSDADYAHFEWSTDNINWYDVRGGQTVSLVSGACVLDDYKFTPGVTNYYRASYVDSAPQANLAGWTNAVGVNAPVAPAIPAGLSAGNLMVLVSSIRNSGAGVPVTPAGWTPMLVSGNVGVYGRYYVPGDTAPSCSYTGGVANADTIAMIFPFANTAITPMATLGQLNGSAQNIAAPAFSSSGSQSMVVAVGWKQDDWTPGTVVALPGFAHGGERVTTTGDDAAIIFDYRIITNGPLSMGSSSFGITGGAAAISRTLMLGLPIRPYVSQDTASNVPNMTSVWLKNVLRPNLNRPITPVGRIEITRKSRSGVFPIVGRSNPITVTDVRGSREFVLNISVADAAERDEITNTLATGDTMYLHVPAGGPVSSVFVLVGDTAWSDELFTYQLPMTEVAEPDGTLVGDTVLWIDVVVEFATWTDLIAAEATWSDVVSQIADGSSVIVP